MIKNKLKNAKGISLISLSIAVIVILVITSIIIYNVKDNLKIERLKNMQNDISNLSDKIETYYAQYGAIPAKEEYTNSESLANIDVISDVVDIGKFYMIDLEALDNLTLNYGEDYKEWKDGANVNTLSDLYIINETSHNIFYVQGIKIEDEIFYTDYTSESIDGVGVNLRYVEGIKIPNGYSYTEGTKNTGITIKSNSDDSQYTWKITTEKINEFSEILLEDGTPLKDKNPEIKNDEDSTKTDKGTFIENVNAHNGYYINSDGNSVISLGNIWTPVYDKDAVFKDKNNNTVKIPSGFQVCMTPTKNTVDDGLVIKDSNGNSYVWIEVPKNETVYKISGLDITEFTDDEYTNIYQDLKLYTKDYRDEDCVDEWYEGCGIDNSTDYNNLKNKMLKSVYQNGGFWIGQYEAGTETVRMNATYGLTIPVSKEGAYPYTWVTCAQAQEQAKAQCKEKGYTTSLMFGIQWDLACKFIETKLAKTMDEIKNNSTPWGNYADANFEIYRGRLWEGNGDWREVEDTYTKDRAVLFTTGSTSRNFALNIYDFAGNAQEWTLEQNKIDRINNGEIYPTIDRGGYCAYPGNIYYESINNGSAGLAGVIAVPASSRHWHSVKNTSNSVNVAARVGFRVALYL